VIGIVAIGAPAICAILLAANVPRAADYQPPAAITCTNVITLRLVNSRMRRECVLRLRYIRVGYSAKRSPFVAARYRRGCTARRRSLPAPRLR
jgi:hypothetical protein